MTLKKTTIFASYESAFGQGQNGKGLLTTQLY